MKLIHRYIFLSVLGTSLAAVALYVFVLLAGSALKDIVGELASGRLTAGMFGRLLLLLIPYVFSYALPMGVLTGVLVVLGRMSANREIVALRAAGFSLWSLAAPVLAVALLAVGTALAINTYYAPAAKRAYRERLANTVRDNPLIFLVPQTFINQFPGYVIYVGGKRGDALEDFWIWELDEEHRAVRLIRAREGTFRYDRDDDSLVLKLDDGFSELRSEKDPDDLRALRPAPAFEELVIKLPLGRVLGQRRLYRKRSAMTLVELAARRDELTAQMAALDAETAAPSGSSPKTGVGTSGGGDEPAAGSPPAAGSGNEERAPPETVSAETAPADAAPSTGPPPKPPPTREERREALRVERGRIMMQLQKNFAMAFSPLAFTLIGIPLSIRVGRRETYANVALAVGLALGWYFLVIAVGWVEKKPDLRPDLLIWTPDAVFQIAGLALLWRAGRR